MKFLLLLIANIIFVVILSAQSTGNFVLNIDFDKDDYKFSRKLYYHVPENYDDAKKYPLVVGFRGGPHINAGQFRTQLSFLSDSLNAIVLCPENADHFNNNEGLVKELFKYSVDTTKSMYNIDSDRIYLTGLSYGGRHAVYVAMDTDNGEIPKLRGVIPFATGRSGQNVPNYDETEKFAPACVCIGQLDNSTFKTVANQLHKRIIDNNGISLLNKIPGVGHTVDFLTYPNEMMKCIRFIESQYTTSKTNNLQNIQIQIFPNPTNQKVNFRIPDNIIPKQIFLNDINGKLLQNISINSREIDIQNTIGDVVFLVIVTNEGIISRKIIISKSIVH